MPIPTENEEMHILGARIEIAAMSGDRDRVARLAPAALGWGRTAAEVNADLDLEADRAVWAGWDRWVRANVAALGARWAP